MKWTTTVLRATLSARFTRLPRLLFVASTVGAMVLSSIAEWTWG